MPTDPIGVRRSEYSHQQQAIENALEQLDMLRGTTKLELRHVSKEFAKARRHRYTAEQRLIRLRQPLKSVLVSHWSCANDRRRQAVARAEEAEAKATERRQYLAQKVMSLRRKLFDIEQLQTSLQWETVYLRQRWTMFESLLREDGRWRPRELWEQLVAVEDEKARPYEEARLALGPRWYTLPGLEERLDVLERFNLEGGRDTGSSKQPL